MRAVVVLEGLVLAVGLFVGLIVGSAVDGLGVGLAVGSATVGLDSRLDVGVAVGFDVCCEGVPVVVGIVVTVKLGVVVRCGVVVSGGGARRLACGGFRRGFRRLTYGGF